MKSVSEATDATERRFSRRSLMVYELAMRGTPFPLAQEAVASTALEHPEWDMDEQLTWSEWLALAE